MADNQADMCVVIRTLLVARKFDNYNLNMKQLSHDFLDMINCYGGEG